MEKNQKNQIKTSKKNHQSQTQKINCFSLCIYHTMAHHRTQHQNEINTYTKTITTRHQRFPPSRNKHYHGTLRNKTKSQFETNSDIFKNN